MAICGSAPGACGKPRSLEAGRPEPTLTCRFGRELISAYPTGYNSEQASMTREMTLMKSDTKEELGWTGGCRGKQV